jgi:hypothetical protein
MISLAGAMWRITVISDSFLLPRLEAINQVRRLMTQKWFARMWIIKEMAATDVGAVVLLGHFPLGWHFLSQIMYGCCKTMAPLSTMPGLRFMFLGDARNMRSLSK